MYFFLNFFFLIQNMKKKILMKIDLVRSESNMQTSLKWKDN